MTFLSALASLVAVAALVAAVVLDERRIRKNCLCLEKTMAAAEERRASRDISSSS